MSLRELSLQIEREHGAISVETIEGKYATIIHGRRWSDDAPGPFRCQWPTCGYRRNRAEKMWIHVHLGPKHAGDHLPSWYFLYQPMLDEAMAELDRPVSV